MENNNHPILDRHPTQDQLNLVGETLDVQELKKYFPKLYNLFLKQYQDSWENANWTKDDDRINASTPEEYTDMSEDEFIILPIDDDFAQIYSGEDYIQPIPGHLALFMENNGFTNVTLVFTVEGLIG